MFNDREARQIASAICNAAKQINDTLDKMIAVAGNGDAMPCGGAVGLAAGFGESHAGKRAGSNPLAGRAPPGSGIHRRIWTVVATTRIGFVASLTS